MAISVNDDAVILDTNIRLKFLRDAEYDAAPPLVAFSGDEQTLLQCTSDGRLKVDASVSIDSVDIGDVDMRAKDTGNVSRYLQVQTDATTSRYALIVNDPQLIDIGITLDDILAALAGGGAGDDYDEYDTASAVASLTPTAVLSYTVPVGKTFYFRAAAGSGYVPAEWWIEVAGTKREHRRTNWTNFNVNFDLSHGGISAFAGETVKVFVEHRFPSVQDFNATIYGRLE